MTAPAGWNRVSSLPWFLVGMTAVILVAVLVPRDTTPSVGISHLDLLVHSSLFFLWTVALARDVSWLQGRLYWVVPLAAAFGLMTETLQLTTPDRSFDLLDVAADTAGSAVALAILKLWPPRA